MTMTELESCVDSFGREILAFCSQLTCSRQEAEDLYQDTFLKATELAEKIDYSQNPKSYLISISLRIWKNRKRKYAWRQRIAGTEELNENTDRDAAGCGINPVEEQIVSDETKLMVQEAVGRLEEKYRIIIYLYYTVELSVEEISRILKIPAGTVKSRLYKARKRLKKKLEVILDEE